MTPRRPTVLLWGAGMSASVHADACRTLGWPVRGVVSRSPQRAAALAASVRSRPLDRHEALASRVADVAIVATPPPMHVDDAIALLEAGYEVVVEAPLACTLDEADRLIAAEGRIGRCVLYSEHLVSAPAIDAMLSDVPTLGRLTHVSARALQAPPDWRSTPRAAWGGDALFDLGVHPIGVVMRIAAESGAGPPRTVSAVLTDGGTEREHAHVTLRFDGALSASVLVGWNPGASADGDVQASSTSGVLRVDLYPTPTLERDGDPVRLPAGPGGPSLVREYGYVGQLARWWATLRTGRGVPATSRLGRLVLEVIAAAHWSAAHGALTVELPFTGPTDRTPRQLLASS